MPMIVFYTTTFCWFHTTSWYRLHQACTQVKKKKEKTEKIVWTDRLRINSKHPCGSLWRENGRIHLTLSVVYLQSGEDAGLLGVGWVTPGAGDAAETFGFTVESISDTHHPTHLTGGWGKDRQTDWKKLRTSSRKECFCWGLFSAVDETTFGASVWLRDVAGLWISGWTDPCRPFRQGRCTPVRWSWWVSGRRRGWAVSPLLLPPAPPRHCLQGSRLRSPRWTRCCSCCGPPPNRPASRRSHGASWTDAPPETEETQSVRHHHRQTDVHRWKVTSTFTSDFAWLHLLTDWVTLQINTSMSLVHKVMLWCTSNHLKLQKYLQQ